MATGDHLHRALDDLLEHSAPVLRASLGLTNPDDFEIGAGPAAHFAASAGYTSFGSTVSFGHVVEEDWDDDEY